MKKSVCVLGAGFSGLAAATALASQGYDVQVVERHAQAGGRARCLAAEGFRFDMGPSWYWMPEVIARYFARFGKQPQDYFQLQRLDPAYRVFHQVGEPAWDIPGSTEACVAFFEHIETGAGQRLQTFLRRAEEKYQLGMQWLRKPAHSLWAYMDMQLWWGCVRLSVLASMRQHVARYFKDPRLRQIMEFPVLFLGASPQRTPALYSLMNYADMGLGTWYPMGGMYALVEAMVRLAEAQGVRIHYQMHAESMVLHKGKGKGKMYALRTQQADIEAEVFVCAADYAHAETLLPASARNYRPTYWQRRSLAPSALLYYIGLDTRVSGLRHHNLFFDTSFQAHISDIYHRPRWPAAPLFYACVPSVTDPGVAPVGAENIFLLVPVAAGLSDTPQLRDQYYQQLLERLQNHTQQPIHPHVIYRHSYGPSDFVADYHAYKGNAYGLANTLRQTALGKPAMRSRRVPNLFFCGQMTHPGPGIPPSIISGELVAEQVHRYLN